MQLTTRTFAGRIFAGIATLTLAGAAGLATVPAADAATAACGSSCTTLAAEEYGSGDVMSVAGLDLRARHVTLAAAGQNSAEDFRQIYLGTVATLFQDDIVNSIVGLHWPADNAYEYEYAPGGSDSGLCLGIPETAVSGAVVNLYACGVDDRTIWVALSGDSQYGYEPLMNGSDTSVTAPEVLTASSLGDAFTTSGLAVINHVLIVSTQMWQTESGVL